jgi:hypothetical protein
VKTRWDVRHSCPTLMLDMSREKCHVLFFNNKKLQ